MAEPQTIPTEFTPGELRTIQQALQRSAAKTRQRHRRALRQPSLESRPAESYQTELEQIDSVQNRITVILGLNHAA